MKLVVILPTYNERENIVAVLNGVRAAVGDVRGYDIVYLVVDDNSPDGTRDTVSEYAKKYPDVYILSGSKEGLGKALLRGMTYAVNSLGADVIQQMDADLSHDPRAVPDFIRAIDQGADFAIGSRYIKGGSIPHNWGLHRKIFSIAGNAIVRFGLGFPRVHDWTGGFRAFKKVYYEKLKNQVDRYSGYVFQIAFLHKSILEGAKIKEVPIHFTDRRFGRSKIAPLSYILNILLYVAGARITDFFSHSFSKFMVVGTIGFIINTVILELMVRLGFHPTVGSIIGAELAIISNFSLNNAWTFRERKIDQGKRFTKFLQFNGTSIGAVIIQGGTIYLGTLIYGVAQYRVFYILGVLIGLVWNYVMYSRVIWRKK